MKPSRHPNQPAATQGRGEPANDATGGQLALRHLRFGWWNLLLFLCLGLVLETLHGFKVGLYLNPSNNLRRLLWTLAHAHGTLFALVNLGFAAAIPRLTRWNTPDRRVASGCLLAATWLLPGGFFLGGLNPFGGDPGIGVFLAPPGAVLALAAVALTACAAQREGR